MESLRNKKSQKQKIATGWLIYAPIALCPRLSTSLLKNIKIATAFFEILAKKICKKANPSLKKNRKITLITYSLNAITE